VVGTEPSAQANHPLAPSLSRRGVTLSIFMHSGGPKAHDIFARPGGARIRRDTED
jgi:hypothetical protein